MTRKKLWWAVLLISLFLANDLLAQNWVPVYRKANSGGGYYEHLYTTNINEATNFTNEGIKFYVSSTQASGLVPLYRLMKNGTPRLRLLTTNQTEVNNAVNAGYTNEGVLGYCYSGYNSQAGEIYRVYKASAGDRFFGNWAETSNAVNNLGYVWENSGNAVFYAPYTQPVAETITISSDPTGETNPNVGQNYTYYLYGASSSQGHSLEYQFNWGDGTSSSWSSSNYASKVWNNTSSYYLNVVVRCQTHTNIMQTSSSIIVIPKNNPPSISISSPNNGFSTNETSVTVSGTASSPNGVNLENVELRVNNGSWQNVVIDQNVSFVNWNKIVNLSLGSNYIEARAYNGQTYSNIASISVTREAINQPPSVNITSPTQSQTFTNSSITVSGTASDPDNNLAAVEIRLNSGSWQSAIGTTNWSFSLTLNSGSNNVIEARAYDGQAYSSIPSVTVTYQPNTPPTVIITKPTANQEFTTPNTTAEGTASDNGIVSEVQVKLNNGDWQTATGTTSWSKSLTLVEGSNTISVKAKDSFQTWSELKTVTFKYTKPNPLSAYFEEAGTKYSIPSNLLKAIAHVSSDWNQALVVGSRFGIMQLFSTDLNGLATKLKADYAGYSGMTNNALIALIKENSLAGTEANIRAGARRLKDLGNNVNPSNSLEAWWFAIIKYGNGPGDESLLNSNFVYRAYNTFLTGVIDSSNTQRVPIIKITLPPRFFFNLVDESTPYELDKILATDYTLIPKTPKPEIINNQVKKGFMRITILFEPWQDLYYLHDNAGNLLTPPNGIKPFSMIFPVKNYTAYNAKLAATLDYTQPTNGFGGDLITDNYVQTFTGEYGFKNYGSINNGIFAGYKNETGGSFQINLANYDYSQPIYLMYDGHDGYDYKFPAGTKVRAVANGTVVSIDEANLGEIVIAHEQGFYSIYRHCSNITVVVNQVITNGLEIAEVGSVGTTGPHLHFSVLKVNSDQTEFIIDPYNWEQDTDKYTKALQSCLWQDNVGGVICQPYNVTVTQLTVNSVKINWDRPQLQNIEGYLIYRGTQLIGSTGPNDSTFTNVNLVAGQTYNYGVAMLIGGTVSPHSGTVSVTLDGGSSAIEENQEKSLVLFNNYPNPFNPTTAIKFSLPEAGNIKLSVYNSKGEFVKELISGKINSGDHQITFDASNLNSGVYFYKLITPQQTINKKMILIK